VRVLLLTGAFQPIDEPRAARCGCDGVLAKPFDVEAMHETVTGLLDSPRGEDAPAARLEAVEQPAAAACDTRPVDGGPLATAVEDASVVADASARAAAAFDTLKALFQQFMAAAPVPREAPPAPVSDICPPTRTAWDESMVDSWTELLRPTTNIDPPPESAVWPTPDEGDAARSQAGGLDRLSAAMHTDSLAEGGALGCDADPAVVASALSLDDYFDMVDEFFAGSPGAVASGGAPCEIPPLHPDPQR